MFVSNGSSFTLSINWNAPADFNCEIVGYAVQLSLVNSVHCANETGQESYIANDITETNITVSKLKPSAHYEVTIKARTSSGWGCAVENYIYDTKYSTIDAPSLHRHPQVTHNSATFVWLPLQCGFHGGELLEYFYRLKSVTSKEIVTGTIPISSNELTLNNLESCKTYFFQIRVRNEEGWGPFSDAKEISTSSRAYRSYFIMGVGRFQKVRGTLYYLSGAPPLVGA
ncbi:putative receptor-type tyrosine-protein phosphatase F [Apostichopus japonicus]|uniref:Putative receptor-type tyrosine-protein phosphatase F n=1 Tax=Stichopus japonicus TaxID=307972 RepID=A0A2G8JDV8_STIJA|nr:putative receptor-type tyrosine-protein phosphatase F [Apostichopus japonicus]